MTQDSKPPCSDEALKAKTGRGWEEWCELLDADGASALDHKELASRIDSMHGAGSWWSQTVAVGYERHRGKRSLHERSDRTFSASASKTLPISAPEAHAYFVEEKKRTLWIGEEMSIRNATAPKSVRIDWSDGTRVAVWITAKGEAKCSVSVEHSKLDSPSEVAARKAFWKSAFDRLTALTK